jgi:pimeloyl-ACP methyl ester carboxylesterase
MKKVVVFIPGIMGSVLSLNGEVVWPGELSELVLPYRKMPQLLDLRLEATDIIRRFSLSKQYESLLEDLQQCGFNEEDESLVVLPYDWRRSISLASEVLAACIERIISQHDKNIEIVLIGHSMGGLVARCYLEYENFVDRDGRRNVKCLITLGTPHRGVPIAFSGALGLEKRLFLSEGQVKDLASRVEFPGLYELMPPSDDHFVWSSNRGDQYIHLDVYDEDVAGSLGLNLDNIAAAKEFHSKLGIQRRPDGARYFFFSGSSQSTLCNIYVRRSVSGFSTTKVYRDFSGDGTVPAVSAAIGGVQGHYVNGEHGTIYRDSELRRTLGVLLGREGVLAGTATQTSISVDRQVYEPECPIVVYVAVSSALSKLDGEIIISRVRAGQNGGLPEWTPVGDPNPVSYQGPQLYHLKIRVFAPTLQGHYRLDLISGSGSMSACEFFVQLT